MSLELLADLEKKIDKDCLDKIVNEITSQGYENVYFHDKYNSYGFIRKGEQYSLKEMPLFDLIIDENQISLSVYASSLDLEIIEKVVTNCFMNEGISIFLEEE